MKKAWIVAGIKLVVGLFLLLSVIGIRVLTAPGGSIESELAELEQLQSTLAQAAKASESSTSGQGSGESSNLRRASTSLSQRGGRDGEADSNRMVACQLAAGRQFMSGGDCAMRGGRATEL